MENRVNQIYITNEGCEIEIIEYINSRDCTVKFKDGEVKRNISYHQVKTGSVKNNNFRSIHKIGFIGTGVFSSKEKKTYKTWIGMLNRCYDKNYQQIHPTYIGCTVDERWHNYQVFAQWFEENYVADFHLDKDILIKGNKVYGPETCVFIPQEINKLLTRKVGLKRGYPSGVHLDRKVYVATVSKWGVPYVIGRFSTPEEAFEVYKVEKEKYIKEVAEEWKGKIDIRIYQTLLKHKVIITEEI